jgi:hypothetical protein
VERPADGFHASESTEEEVEGDDRDLAAPASRGSESPVAVATPQPPPRHLRVDTLGSPDLERPAAADPPPGGTPDDAPADELTDEELHRQVPVPGSVREFCDILMSRFGIDISGDPLVSGIPADFGVPGGAFGGDTSAPRSQVTQPHARITEADSGRPPPMDQSPPGAARAPPGMI